MVLAHTCLPRGIDLYKLKDVLQVVHLNCVSFEIYLLGVRCLPFSILKHFKTY